MGYIETNLSWDYVGMTIYPLDENGIETGASYYLPDMGLFRISNSNRYNDILVPTLKHTTVEVPGGDGMYWFGSQHTQKPFTVKLAYDSLTEENLHLLRSLLNGKKRLHIIFDEYPYKYYDVVVSAAPQFDYVVYTEDRIIDGVETPRRIFKGESSIQFVSYLPYSVGNIWYWDKTISPQYNWANWDELQGTTNILTKSEWDTKQIDEWVNDCYRLWNGGDLPCDWRMTISKDLCPSISRIECSFTQDGTVTGTFLIDPTNPFNENEINTALTFDTRLHLIYDQSGKFFNKHLVGEYFQQLPVSNKSLNEESTIKLLDINNNAVVPSTNDQFAFDYEYRFY